MMKKIFFLFLFLGIAGVVLISALEILSKNYQCKKPFFPSPCSGDGTGPIIFILPEESSFLTDLKNKRRAGEEISKEEYQEATDKFIREVDVERLPGLNGIACSGVGYVRNDLPKEAKKYVKRHELEHLLGEGEFKANMAAGREYPLGLIQTIFFTLKDRAKYYDSPICYISTLWKTFKIYFLP